MSPLRVGVLFSARTDLARSLIDVAAVDPNVAVVAAATDRRHEPEAIPSGVPLRDFPTGRHADRVQRDIAMADWLEARHTDLVVAAGWLWLLGQVVEAFAHDRVQYEPTTARWTIAR